MKKSFAYAAAVTLVMTLATVIESFGTTFEQYDKMAFEQQSQFITECARTIYASGTDLLNLINDILDLSKIESGTVTVEAEEITFQSLRDSVARTFHHIAEAKGVKDVLGAAAWTYIAGFAVSVATAVDCGFGSGLTGLILVGRFIRTSLPCWAGLP